MRGLRILAGAASLLVLSCVSYDFEPVEVVALSSERVHVDVVGLIPPNVMLVIDKSGSMDLPMNPSDPDCGSCGQTKNALCNTATCATRWSELQSAMNAVLPTSQGFSRFGLVTYPADAVCGSPGTVRFSIPQSDDAQQLANAASLVNSTIQGITSAGVAGTPNTTGGGTPTAKALQIVGTDTAFDPNDKRADVAILLTDGLPNCNANNPNSWTTNPAACRCTLGSDCSGFPREGCLDDTASVAAVEALTARGIKVVVVGFGADVTSGPGPDVLRALATAGGYQRDCAAASDCAMGDTCNAGHCSSGLFLPTNSAEIADLLHEVAFVGDPCKLQLSEPADMRHIEVWIDEKKLPASDWSLSGSEITVSGAGCSALTNATLTTPVKVDVWALRTLPANP